MKWTRIIWDHLPGGNVDHIEEHDLTTQDIDHVLENYQSEAYSASTGCPCIFGYIPDGRYVIVIFEQYDDTVYPKTAYEVPEP